MDGICGEPEGWNNICAFVIRSSHRVSYRTDVRKGVELPIF